MPPEIGHALNTLTLSTSDIDITMKEYYGRRRETAAEQVIKQFHWPEPSRPTDTAVAPKKPRKPRKTYVDGEFTRREDVVIKKYYPEHGPHYTAELLDRNPARVRSRAIWLGLGDYFERPWQTAEDHYVRESLGKRSVLQVSRVLNRTQRNVEDRIELLGLRVEDFGRKSDGRDRFED